MRNKLLLLPLISIFCSFGLVILQSCNDDTSKIGATIAPGEVNITIDSLAWNLNAVVEEYNMFDSKSGNLLLGNINIPEYGALTCSFVTRFMPAPKIEVPDSLFFAERVDSCKFTMLIPDGQFTGDSLSPQRITVYELTRQLPSDINNLFEPEGYFDPSNSLGSSSFILSDISINDTTVSPLSYHRIDVPLKKEFGKSIFEQYKNNPATFEWPQSLTSFLPGFLVQQTFGKGLIANISEAFVIIYYNHKEETTVITENDTITQWVNQRDSIVPLIVSPEVLSSNNVKYDISDEIRNKVESGKSILTTPCGYKVSFTFPAKELIRQYEDLEAHLSTVSDLLLSIPASSIENNHGISCAPNLLLIKSDEVEDFFSGNNKPDGKTSFLAAYNSSDKKYQFASMRDYIVNLMNKTDINDNDCEFSIIPVDVTYETEQGYFGNTTTYITKCVPYTAKPTVTQLDTENAMIVFSFSSQMID